jgi:hypothetical protein
MRLFSAAALVSLLLPASALGQQAFYSHDNYTQYELLEPGSSQFAITYYMTERRAGSQYVLNQTRSGSAGSDIAVFDPRTGKALKFDYLSGAELTAAGMPGKYDPAEHYIRAHLPNPVPENGEGRVKILKTYKDDKSYFTEGDVVIFRRSLGNARNSIVLPKGYRLQSSNVAAQVFTLPDGRLKVAFEHAHGYAADVTIRASRSTSLPPAPMVSERGFDFTKALYEFPDAGSVTVTRESLVTPADGRVAVEAPAGTSDVTAIDVDSGQRLTLRHTAAGGLSAELPGGTAATVSARIRVSGKLKTPPVAQGTGFSWTRTIGEPRATILLPAGFDVQSVSVPATVTAQPDGRVVIQVYNGALMPMPVTIAAAKR